MRQQLAVKMVDVTMPDELLFWAISAQHGHCDELSPLPRQSE
jgi:hypothetical protein